MLTLDLVLAVAHHLAAFGLLAILVVQYVALGAAVDGAAARQLSRIDAGYGLTALVLVAVGFARATLAAKGWAFYEANPFFWAKVGLFAAIALISVRPTLAFRRWRRVRQTQGEPIVEPGEVASVRRTIGLELGLFAGLPVFAAAMARGVGMG